MHAALVVPAAAWVALNVFDGLPDNAVIATVPGSYQDEIGCPGDWDPGCLRSWLQDPDGDAIYSFTTADIPAGDYEAKVAHNESWDENYGAGGEPNGPNIPFSVGSNQVVTFTYDPVTHVLEITLEGGVEPGDEDLVRPVLQHPFQDQILYFAIPDRFANGDPSNDNIDGYEDNADRDDDYGRHGGDLEGIRQHLDYIADTGFTQIWMNPLLENGLSFTNGAGHFSPDYSANQIPVLGAFAGATDRNRSWGRRAPWPCRRRRYRPHPGRPRGR